MKKISNILIRQLSDEDREALGELMREVKVGQASKAVMYAVHAFRRNLKVIRRLAERVRELECENRILRGNSEKIVKAVGDIDKVLSKTDG